MSARAPGAKRTQAKLLMKGFLSFALGAAFLAALVSSASFFSSFKPGHSYQKYPAAALQDVAIKSAFYSFVSHAAKTAYGIALSQNKDPAQEVRHAAHQSAVDFYLQMKEAGHSIAIWCASTSEYQRAMATRRMAEQAQAILPEGSTELSASNCQDSFGANSLQRKLYFRNLGFSAYFPSLGLGMVSVFPNDFEVGF